ncbi:MAG: GNAT family N-acetyltransferase [Microvirga sp.]|nr:GNAT family N-acetyltransferase [Microvirga sp.]
MTPPVIRDARESDLPALAELARAGGGAALEFAALDLCRAAGTLWAGLDEGGGPIGYLAASECDGALLVLDLRVSEPARRRGVAAALLMRAIDHARWAFIPAVVAVADPEAPWGGPFLARRGFVALDASRAGPGLRARLDAERSVAGAGERRLMAKLL